MNWLLSLVFNVFFDYINSSTTRRYNASLKDYKKNPQKYKGQPGPPNFKYIDRNPCEIIFTKPGIRIRNDKLLLSLSKKIKSKYNVKSLKFELPEAVQSIVDLETIQQIKIKQDHISKRWYLLIIYINGKTIKSKNAYLNKSSLSIIKSLA
jgi:hypothetical protein